MRRLGRRIDSDRPQLKTLMQAALLHGLPRVKPGNDDDG
jgi:hypothetical protein